MPGRLPCSPGCTCKKHVRVFSSLGPCPSGCECGKHTAMTPERRAYLAELRTGAPISEETRQLLSTINLKPESSFISGRYRYLTGQVHPLARHGQVGEHRKVLYDSIGPGEHDCHWCGKRVSWGGIDGIHADHLDDDPLNNDPDNLVPSCLRRNWGRSRVYV